MSKAVSNLQLISSILASMVDFHIETIFALDNTTGDTSKYRISAAHHMTPFDSDKYAQFMATVDDEFSLVVPDLSRKGRQDHMIAGYIDREVFEHICTDVMSEVLPGLTALTMEWAKWTDNNIKNNFNVRSLPDIVSGIEAKREEWIDPEIKKIVEGNVDEFLHKLEEALICFVLDADKLYDGFDEDVDEGEEDDE